MDVLVNTSWLFLSWSLPLSAFDFFPLSLSLSLWHIISVLFFALSVFSPQRSRSVILPYPPPAGLSLLQEKQWASVLQHCSSTSAHQKKNKKKTSRFSHEDEMLSWLERGGTTRCEHSCVSSCVSWTGLCETWKKKNTSVQLSSVQLTFYHLFISGGSFQARRRRRGVVFHLEDTVRQDVALAET